jgi:hypothetical protein
MSDTILRQAAIDAVRSVPAGTSLRGKAIIAAINAIPRQPDPQVTALVEACRAVVEANNFEASTIGFLMNLNNVAKRCQNALNAWEQSNG